MTIYFIRHGQSEFNAAFRHEGDPMIFDAPLTELGIEQARAAREKVADLGIKLAITSPLTRAIQTAQHIFGGVAPIQVHAGHHEYLLHSCDVGSTVSTLRSRFSDLDFDHLPERWWHHETGHDTEILVEPTDAFKARIAGFVEALDHITDLPVAIVGHGNAFQEIIGRMMTNCEIYKYR